MAAFIFDASGIVKRYLTEIGSAGNSGVRASFRREIRCRFVFSGKNDELTPDFYSWKVQVPQTWGLERWTLVSSTAKTW